MASDKKYTTVAGDTWDSIAYRFWGDEFKMTQLQAANPDYLDVLVFNSGVILQVPEIDPKPSDNLPEWKQ